MLDSAPNRTIPHTLKAGAQGWPVYGLQRGLNSLGATIGADGAFGPVTELAVRAYQRESGLLVDGLAGRDTQWTIVQRIEHVVDGLHAGLPVGLLRGLTEMESGSRLGAVNWSVAGGVDCGILQRRIIGPPFRAADLRAAYSPAAAMDASARELTGRATTYRGYGLGRERAWRLALLGHNWPWAAAQLARYRKLPDPDGRAGWVPAGVLFPDGVRVRSRIEWCEFYALGGKHGEATGARYVTDW